MVHIKIKSFGNKFYVPSKTYIDTLMRSKNTFPLEDTFPRSFKKRQTNGISSDNEWCNEWQRMKTGGTASDNE